MLTTVTCQFCQKKFQIFPYLAAKNARPYCSHKCYCLHKQTDEYIRQRFWEKVIIAKPEDCWLWQGARRQQYGQEYGRFLYQAKIHLAHRISYLFTYGPFLDDDCVLHKCDTPPCVNPTHLFLGTRNDNNIDKAKKGRARKVLTPQQAKEIFTLKGKYSLSKTAAMFNVHFMTISDIWHGRIWSWVTNDENAL